MSKGGEAGTVILIAIVSIGLIGAIYYIVKIYPENSQTALSNANSISPSMIGSDTLSNIQKTIQASVQIPQIPLPKIDTSNIAGTVVNMVTAALKNPNNVGQSIMQFIKTTSQPGFGSIGQVPAGQPGAGAYLMPTQVSQGLQIWANNGQMPGSPTQEFPLKPLTIANITSYLTQWGIYPPFIPIITGVFQQAGIK